MRSRQTLGRKTVQCQAFKYPDWLSSQSLPAMIISTFQRTCQYRGCFLQFNSCRPALLPAMLKSVLPSPGRGFCVNHSNYAHDATLAICLSRLEWIDMKPEAHMLLARRIHATKNWAYCILVVLNFV